MSLPVRAVILDWAGTTVDFGSRAPTRVFVEIFRRRGLAITEAEARGPMGSAKRDHIAAILLGLPRVAAAWREAHGRAPAEADVDALYHEFLPLQKSILAEGSDVIPGVPEAITELRRHGLRIGSTTGYTRELMDVVAPAAAHQGYAPSVTICSDDVAAGRPAPWMNFRAAEAMGVYPMGSILIVDDTIVGIEAARAAGAIAVGVSRTGNALGLSLEDAEALDADDLTVRLETIAHDFRRAGAHHVLDSVADLPTLVAHLNAGA